MQKFLIIGNARTGTTLLQGLIGSHPNAIAGGEIFHPKKIEDGVLDWPVLSLRDDARLLQLRETDPLQFLEQLFERSATREIRAIGFKLLYYQTATMPVIRDLVARDSEWKVVHIKRSNLLRRFISSERARQSSVYQRSVRDDVPKRPPEPIVVDIGRLLADIPRAESETAEAERTFATNPTLDVTYEDLAADPKVGGQKAVEFLGLDPSPELAIKVAQLAGGPLRDEIANYDEVQAALGRWSYMLTQ